jgi:hypothetical protein
MTIPSSSFTPLPPSLSPSLSHSDYSICVQLGTKNDRRRETDRIQAARATLADPPSPTPTSHPLPHPLSRHTALVFLSLDSGFLTVCLENGGEDTVRVVERGVAAEGGRVAGAWVAGESRVGAVVEVGGRLSLVSIVIEAKGRPIIETAAELTLPPSLARETVEFRSVRGVLVVTDTATGQTVSARVDLAAGTFSQVATVTAASWTQSFFWRPATDAVTAATADGNLLLLATAARQLRVIAVESSGRLTEVASLPLPEIVDHVALGVTEGGADPARVLVTSSSRARLYHLHSEGGWELDLLRTTTADAPISFAAWTNDMSPDLLAVLYTGEGGYFGVPVRDGGELEQIGDEVAVGAEHARALAEGVATQAADYATCVEEGVAAAVPQVEPVRDALVGVGAVPVVALRHALESLVAKETAVSAAVDEILVPPAAAGAGALRAAVAHTVSWLAGRREPGDAGSPARLVAQARLWLVVAETAASFVRRVVSRPLALHTVHGNVILARPYDTLVLRTLHRVEQAAAVLTATPPDDLDQVLGMGELCDSLVHDDDVLWWLQARAAPAARAGSVGLEPHETLRRDTLAVADVAVALVAAFGADALVSLTADHASFFEVSAAVAAAPDLADIIVDLLLQVDSVPDALLCLDAVLWTSQQPPLSNAGETGEEEEEEEEREAGGGGGGGERRRAALAECAEAVEQDLVGRLGRVLLGSVASVARARATVAAALVGVAAVALRFRTTLRLDDESFDTLTATVLPYLLGQTVSAVLVRWACETRLADETLAKQLTEVGGEGEREGGGGGRKRGRRRAGEAEGGKRHRRGLGLTEADRTLDEAAGDRFAFVPAAVEGDSLSLDGSPGAPRTTDAVGMVAVLAHRTQLATDLARLLATLAPTARDELVVTAGHLLTPCLHLVWRRVLDATAIAVSFPIATVLIGTRAGTLLRSLVERLTRPADQLVRQYLAGVAAALLGDGETAAIALRAAMAAATAPFVRAEVARAGFGYGETDTDALLAYHAHATQLLEAAGAPAAALALVQDSLAVADSAGLAAASPPVAAARSVGFRAALAAGDVQAAIVLASLEEDKETRRVLVRRLVSVVLERGAAAALESATQSILELDLADALVERARLSPVLPTAGTPQPYAVAVAFAAARGNDRAAAQLAVEWHARLARESPDTAPLRVEALQAALAALDGIEPAVDRWLRVPDSATVLRRPDLLRQLAWASATAALRRRLDRLAVPDVVRLLADAGRHAVALTLASHEGAALEPVLASLAEFAATDRADTDVDAEAVWRTAGAPDCFSDQRPDPLRLLLDPDSAEALAGGLPTVSVAEAALTAVLDAMDAPGGRRGGSLHAAAALAYTRARAPGSGGVPDALRARFLQCAPTALIQGLLEKGEARDAGRAAADALAVTDVSFATLDSLLSTLAAEGDADLAATVRSAATQRLQAVAQ